MYATVENIRSEGVTEKMAGDSRIGPLIDEATGFIDKTTGWFFEPREKTFTLDGRGTHSLELPVPPIKIDELVISGERLENPTSHLYVAGAPVNISFESARIAFIHGAVFLKGRGNVHVTGLWGYTEDDGTVYGRTPLAIRRACILLVLRWLYPLADDLSEDAKNRWRIVEEKTKDQSYKLSAIKSAGPFTGDQEIDNILLQYMRPTPMGAA